MSKKSTLKKLWKIIIWIKNNWMTKVFNLEEQFTIFTKNFQNYKSKVNILLQLWNNYEKMLQLTKIKSYNFENKVNSWK